jgi:hypothetical protein
MIRFFYKEEIDPLICADAAMVYEDFSCVDWYFIQVARQME